MDPASRATLVESHGWIVAQFVAHYRGRANGADLAEAGYLGLCEAARLYQPGRGVKFSTYAWTWVKGCVLEELRTAHVVPISKRAALGKTQTTVQAPRLVSDAALESGAVGDAEDEQQQRDPRRRRVALQRIAGLPTDAHRLVAARALEGRSIEQIASVLEMPRGRVIRLLSEAERQLEREAA